MLDASAASRRRHFCGIGRHACGFAARRGGRLTVLLTFALGMLLVQAAPAGAVALLGPPSAQPAVRGYTQVVMSNPITGNGQAVNGFSANANNAFDPTVPNAYPTSNPPTGGTSPLWSVHNISFAGTLRAMPVGGGSTLLLYCIDIHTVTRAGYGYELGSWEASGMPNVGYVARLLTDYYPNTNAPTNLTNSDQRAAAVQAAIWFLTDRFVVSTSGSGSDLRSTVVNIVNTVIAQGPLITPPPPSLTITPTSLSGHVHVLGPFTVATNHLPVTLTGDGGTMYSNAAATVQLGNGTTATLHSSPHQIWLRASAGNTSDTVILYATSTATVPSGNVYLYDGAGGPDDAQRVILAAPATLTTTVRAIGEFKPFGELIVRKTIAGPAAASRGTVVIRVKCDDGVARPYFVIPAGAPAGTHTRTYGHIPAGTECTVIERSDGSTATTMVVVTGNGQEVIIPAGGTKTVDLKDVYRPVPSIPGSLIVTKTITGPSAGEQGPVTIQAVCNGVTLSPDFVVPAHTPAGTVSHRFDNIAAGSSCTVTETANGATPTVIVQVIGNGQTVTISAATAVSVSLTDVYDDGSPTKEVPDEPGSPAVAATGILTVVKHISGPAARHHGRIAILVTCGGPLEAFSFDIPPGTGPGSVTRHFDYIPSGLRCQVVETAKGHTNAVAVTASSSRTATIPATGSATVRLTDSFTMRTPAPPPPTVTG